MIITVKGIELEIPDNANVEILPNGRVKVNVAAVEAEVIERIRIVEIEVPGPETIRLVPQADYPDFSKWGNLPIPNNQPWRDQLFGGTCGQDSTGVVYGSNTVYTSNSRA